MRFQLAQVFSCLFQDNFLETRMVQLAKVFLETGVNKGTYGAAKKIFLLSMK